jgi:hypothetical protein
MITVTNLRKIFTEQGIKGASSWNRATFDATINDAHEAANLEAERLLLASQMTATTPKGKCTECGRKEDFRLSGLCAACREYGEWENAHSDEGHDDNAGAPKESLEDCQVCHPELDGRKARKSGRSRAGMVIIAKGTELHKSTTFAKAAEAAGWTVDITREFYELPEGTEGEGTRFYATATRGEDSISLAWDGRAYDYPASSARLAGKDRKVRNLKEALRLI